MQCQLRSRPISTLSRLRPYLLPLALFVLSFLLRLSLISKGPYHIDCLELAVKAEQSLETHKLNFLFGPGYPGTVLLGTIFVFLARLFSVHDPVMAVNFMSVVFGALSVLANYYLVKSLFSTEGSSSGGNIRAAVFSSLMLSFLPAFMTESVYGKNHAVSLFFLLAGLASLCKYQRTPNKTNFLLSVFCFALLGATRLQDLILMGVPVGFLCLFPPRWKAQPAQRYKLSWHNFLLFMSLTISFTALFHFPFLMGENRESYGRQLSQFWHMGTTFEFRGPISSSLGVSLGMIIAELSATGMLLALLGMQVIFRKNSRIFFFLLLWTLVPLLFYGNFTVVLPRFLIISLLPLIIAQGYFLSYLTEFKKPLLTAGTVLGFILIVALLFSEIYPQLRFRHEHNVLLQTESGLGAGRDTSYNAD